MYKNCIGWIALRLQTDDSCTDINSYFALICHNCDRCIVTPRANYVHDAVL